MRKFISTGGSLSVGLQACFGAGNQASRVQVYLLHQHPLLCVQYCADTTPLSLSSKLTLSHLSVLTSAVCPVLPDSL